MLFTDIKPYKWCFSIHSTLVTWYMYTFYLEFVFFSYMIGMKKNLQICKCIITIYVFKITKSYACTWIVNRLHKSSICLTKTNMEIILMFWTFQRFFEYEKLLDDIVTAIDPLLDSQPPYLPSLTSSTIREKLKTLPAVKTLLKSCEWLINSTKLVTKHFYVKETQICLNKGSHLFPKGVNSEKAKISPRMVGPISTKLNTKHF